MKPPPKDKTLTPRPGMPRQEVPAGTYFINFSLMNPSRPLRKDEREAVFRVICDGHRQRYILNGVAVMPTHVHIVLQARTEEGTVGLPKIMHRIKGYSAMQVNKLRESSGALWLPRYYNRLIYSTYEYEQKMEYLIDNPRRARIVKDPNDYPYLWYQGKEGDFDG